VLTDEERIQRTVCVQRVHYKIRMISKNLSYLFLGARELRDFFESHELDVIDVQFVSDKNAIKHKGTAYVEF
jgi:hypothetical protein